MRKLLLPEQAAAEWARRFARQHLAWWAGHGVETDAAAWPQALSLGSITAAEVAEEPSAVRAWVTAWQGWAGPGEVRWEERQWPRLGTQRLPAMLTLPTPEAVAELAGQGMRWRRAVDHRRLLAGALPPGATMPSGSRIFEALADWPDAEIERLVAVLRWAGENRTSGLYLRQLPVPGLDSKWIEQRRAVITDLAAALPGNGIDAARDLHTLLGLVRATTRLRLRVLCATLRRQVGGLSDIEAPRDEVAALAWEPAQVLVVENLESGLALPDLPGTVAFMKLGHAVGLLADIPWLRSTTVRYWGDIDSHGLAILNQARRVLPQAESMLMDRATLLAHRSLCVPEPEPWSGPALEHLSAPERALFADLAAGTWGPRLRLEQERIPWLRVLETLGATQPLPEADIAPAPAATAARRPPHPQAQQVAETGYRQLDIFADSGDVMRRNAFAEAVLADDAAAARAALDVWQHEWPADVLLAPAAQLMAQLMAHLLAPLVRAGSRLAPPLSAAAVLAASDKLDNAEAPAAAALLGDAATSWMAARWRRLAQQAHAVAWHPEQAQAHGAALFLRAGDWAAAAEAVASIDSWRRIPQPLLWMCQARWFAAGADSAWPLLAAAFWLAPARAHALLASLADRRLRQAMGRFEDDFELVDDEDWAWWPAWLAVDQPLLAELLGPTPEAPDRAATEACRLVGSLLRLEREGRHHDIVLARKRLQALEPRLFACYMRTR